MVAIVRIIQVDHTNMASRFVAVIRLNREEVLNVPSVGFNC